jgi:hypothetical protein
MGSTENDSLLQSANRREFMYLLVIGLLDSDYYLFGYFIPCFIFIFNYHVLLLNWQYL